MTTTGPLDQWRDHLDPVVRTIVERETPIPTVAGRAAAVAAQESDFVRADIGQISGLDPELEVLYGPPVGLEPLRSAVAELWTRTFGLAEPLGAPNVVITTGAAEALSVFFRCFARDRVVGLPRGHWENYLNAVELAGGAVEVVDYFDHRGRLDVEGLRRTIEKRRISILLSNFPCNPTGAVLSTEESRALATLARERDVLMVADEVYSRLRFDGHPPVSLLPFAPERTVVVSSASKEYLIPGARVGYAICARPEITDHVFRKMIRANTASPNVLGQRRLLELLAGELEDLRGGREPALLVRIRDELRERKSRLCEVLRSHGFSLVGRAGRDPEGTIFLMAGIPDWFDGDDTDLVEAALEHRCFSSIPGSAFGVPGAIRLSFGGMTTDAVGRLDGALRRLRDLT